MAQRLRSSSATTNLSHDTSNASSVYTPSAHLLNSSQWDEEFAHSASAGQSRGDISHPLWREPPPVEGGFARGPAQIPVHSIPHVSRVQPQLPPPDPILANTDWSARARALPRGTLQHQEHSHTNDRQGVGHSGLSRSGGSQGADDGSFEVCITALAVN